MFSSSSCMVLFITFRYLNPSQAVVQLQSLRKTAERFQDDIFYSLVMKGFLSTLIYAHFFFPA